MAFVNPTLGEGLYGIWLYSIWLYGDDHVEAVLARLHGRVVVYLRQITLC